MRDKLIGLIYNATLDCWLKDGEKKPVRIVDSGAGAAYLADYLLAHGVTLQEWVSVEERLPQMGEQVLVYMNGERCILRLANDAQGEFWTDYEWGDYHLREVSCWMSLPAPPKEE